MALALGQFVEWVGDPSSWNTFWTFGVTAALGFYAGAVKGIRFQLLAASIATIVAWSALERDPVGRITRDFGVYRGLLGILSIILLAGALHLASLAERPRHGHRRQRRRRPGCLEGVGAGHRRGHLGCAGLQPRDQLDRDLRRPLGFAEFTIVETSAVWDAFLLLISLGLVGLGTLVGTRGPVYVGAIGLVLFLFIVGLDLDDETPEPDKLGVWPIVLIALGLLAVALGALKEASLGDRPSNFLKGLRK